MFQILTRIFVFCGLVIKHAINSPYWFLLTNVTLSPFCLVGRNLIHSQRAWILCLNKLKLRLIGIHKLTSLCMWALSNELISKYCYGNQLLLVCTLPKSFNLKFHLLNITFSWTHKIKKNITLYRFSTNTLNCDYLITYLWVAGW